MSDLHERSERVRLHLNLNTYQAVNGDHLSPWCDVEKIDLGTLRRAVEIARKDADRVIEAERLSNDRGYFDHDWDE